MYLHYTPNMPKLSDELSPRKVYQLLSETMHSYYFQDPPADIASALTYPEALSYLHSLILQNDRNLSNILVLNES